MHRPFLIIERHKKCSHKEYSKRQTGFESITHSERKAPFEQALLAMKGYKDYVKKHGLHFTDELAEAVSKMFINADGSYRHWTAAQAKKAFTSLGYTIPSYVTTGDITYLANMAYSDFYPEVLKDEASCLKYACKVANDPDGYEGLPFCRWTADVIGKSLDIDWEKYL